MLEKIGKDSKYLNYSELSENVHISRIAKLKSFVIKESEATADKYAILHLRDRNGAYVMASLFNLESATDANVLLKPLKGGLIKISAVVGTFNQRYTLRISSLENIEGVVDAEAEAIFSRKFADAEKYIAEIKKIYSTFGLEMTPSAMWEFSSIDRLYDGKVGGPAKFFNDVVRASSAYLRSPGMDAGLFLKCLHVSLEIYIHSLGIETKLGSKESLTLINMMRSVENSQLFDETTYPVAFDAMMAVLDMGEATHIYSHLIKDITKSCMTAQELISTIPSLSLGDVVKVGERTLAMY